MRPNYVAHTSNLAQRAPAELRSEAIAFEREAAIAKTAPAMSQTPPEILKLSTAGAELADRLTIAREQDVFRLELRGQSGNGAAGLVKREECSASCRCCTASSRKPVGLPRPAPPGRSPQQCQPIRSRRGIRAILS